MKFTEHLLITPTAMLLGMAAMVAGDVSLDQGEVFVGIMVMLMGVASFCLGVYTLTCVVSACRIWLVAKVQGKPHKLTATVLH